MERNGTTYDNTTAAAVIDALEAARANGQRLVIYYGDVATGRAWDDRPEYGTIGRSTGPVKIPILLHNARSIGGGPVMDNRIVKIETTRAPRRVLYQHSNYHTNAK